MLLIDGLNSSDDIHFDFVNTSLNIPTQQNIGIYFSVDNDN